MPDAPTPLDLDAIVAAIAECRTYNFGMYQADRLAHEHAPALVAEVKRLRAEVARPAPAWNEEAVVEGMARAVYPFLFTDDRQPLRVFGETRSDAELREGERNVARQRMRQALAIVRDHLPVKPSREEVARALALVGDYDGCFERLDAWAAASSEARECGDVEEPMSTDGEDAEWWLKRADAILDLLPGRSEAEVKAEALNEAADWLADMDDGRDTGQHRAGRDIIARLRDRADRTAAEGGADRG